MTTGDETIFLLHELEKHGFSDTEFKKMHHQGVSIERHKAYCAGREFDHGSRNEILLVRLRLELIRRRGNVLAGAQEMGAGA